jgi:hypothetical protein
MMEVDELRKLLQDVKVEHVTEAGRLAILSRDISKVLVYLFMPPIPGIPRDLRMAGDIFELVDIILECLWEAYASGHGPWD